MLSRTIMLLFIAASAAACTVRGNIPDLHGDATCDPGYEEKIPPFCDWARSVDAIVVGKVTGLRLSYTDPVSLATGGDGAPDCSPVSGILQMDLELTTVVTGPLRAGEKLRVIAHDTGYWEPRPGHNDTEREVVLWAPRGAEPGIVVGQQLGTVLHRQLGGPQWGTRFEPLFLEEDGRLRFSTQNGLCDMVAPIKTGDFAAVSDFARAIDACPVATAAAAARHNAIASDASWRPVCLDRNPAEGNVNEGE